MVLDHGRGPLGRIRLTLWTDNQPTDRKVLDKSGRWADMPFLLLAKCAEAQAIRKGWPEDLSNTLVSRDPSRRRSFTSSEVAARAVSPASRFFRQKSFDHRSLKGYDEPEILPSSISPICFTSADGGHTGSRQHQRRVLNQ